jgi:WhiB family transcriptional regulator, redox-sensing transcriptional regulator
MPNLRGPDLRRTGRRTGPEAGNVMAATQWEIGWQYQAACRGEDSELFFAPNYFEKKEEKEAREAKAKAICARCPVRSECLDYALRNREPHGIWGGLNELERKAILRDRGRQAG